MPTLEELRQTRIEKLKSIKTAGENPYPPKVRREHSVETILKKFWIWSFGQKNVFLAGRIKTIRVHSKAAFFDLEDGTGKIQCFANPADLKDFDIGDFTEIRGKLFKTKKGEKTVRVNKIKMIAKALRPLPEKWHGLTDIEERYRKRYLDLLMNPKIKEKFLLRSKILQELRNFLDSKGFLEFETPILQNIPGGATARPFKTHLNALNMDLYLRIALELYLKRLLVGGFEKVYEIGRVFRNEGMDAVHNPEYTLLEAYIAYENSDFLKNFIKSLLICLAKKFNKGKTIIDYGDNKINLEGLWKDRQYNDLIKEFGDLDIAKKTLIHPTFVSGFPAEMLPLAKTLEKDKSKAEAFQIFIGGLELVKAFTEQNSPLEQRQRFEEQEKLRAAGEEEAQRLDEDFLEALEYGMPHCAGFGLGIDRLVMLLTNSHSVREVILFPTMKPKE